MNPILAPQTAPLLELIERWAQCGWLRALDAAFAAFLARIEPQRLVAEAFDVEENAFAFFKDLLHETVGVRAVLEWRRQFPLQVVADVDTIAVLGDSALHRIGAPAKLVAFGLVLSAVLPYYYFKGKGWL